MSNRGDEQDNMKSVMEYAVYKGEEIICFGTAKECAETMNVKPETIKYYLTPAYERKIAKRKNSENHITVIKIDDEDSED